MKKITPRLSLLAVATSTLLVFTACADSKGKESAIPDAPDAAIETIIKEFAKGNGGILWEAMPATYQSDVNELVRLSGTKMDAEIYNKSFALIGRLGAIVNKQKDFILNTEMAAGQDAEKKAEIKKALPSLVGFLETVSQSNIASVEGLLSFNGGAFFDTTVSQLLEHAKELSKLSDEASVPMSELEKVVVTLVEKSGDSAKLALSIPGNEAPDEQTFTKVENRWVPAEMADDWSSKISEARESLAELTPEEMAKNKPQIMGVLAMVDGVLNQLEAAETQAQFDQALQGAMMPIMGLMMMGNGLNFGQ